MRVILTAKRAMNFPLTPEYCRHSATPSVEMALIRWEKGAQDSSRMKTRTEKVSIYPSLDLLPGVPSEALHSAVLNIPHVKLAIRGRLLRTKMVP